MSPKKHEMNYLEKSVENLQRDVSKIAGLEQGIARLKQSMTEMQKQMKKLDILEQLEKRLLKGEEREEVMFESVVKSNTSEQFDSGFVKVPIFTGGDLESWISWMEKYFSDQGFRECEKLPFAYGFIEDEAWAWVDRENSLVPFTGWSEFKNNLLWQFCREYWSKDVKKLSVVEEVEYQEVAEEEDPYVSLKNQCQEEQTAEQNQRDHEQALNAYQVFDKMILGENRAARQRKKRKSTKAKRFKYKCWKMDSKTHQIQKILRRTEVMFEVERDTREKMSNTCLLTQLRWLLRVTQRKKKRKRHKHYEKSQERIRDRLLVMEMEKYNWRKCLELGQRTHQMNGEQFVVNKVIDGRVCDGLEIVTLDNASSRISELDATLTNAKVKGCLNQVYGEANDLLVNADEWTRLKIRLVIKSGYIPEAYVSVANSIISMYSKCGDTEAAKTVFEKVLCKDVISWNAILNGFASNGMFQEAFGILKEMQLADSMQPDIATMVTVTTLCGELCLSQEGREIHGYTVRRQMQSKALEVINSLIDMYGRCGLIKQAELLFKTTTARDMVSCNTMLSAFAQSGFTQEAKNLFKELVIHCWQLKLGFGDDIISANSIINMYIGCGDLTSAFLLLEVIPETRDLTTWNSVIYGCASEGHYSESLRAFYAMSREEKVRHDLITLLGAIAASGNLGLILMCTSSKGIVGGHKFYSDSHLEDKVNFGQRGIDTSCDLLVTKSYDKSKVYYG